MGFYLVKVQALMSDPEDFSRQGVNVEFELLTSADDEKSAMTYIERLHKECRSLHNHYYDLKAISAEYVLGNLTRLTWADDFFDDL